MDKFEIKNTLYKRNLKSRPLSILLYLIDRANKDLICFPSIKTISSDLNISVSTTKRALNYLVEIGYIEKTERFLDITGKQTSNLYTININNIEKGTPIKEVKNIEEIENIQNKEDEKNIDDNNKSTINENLTIFEINSEICNSKYSLIKKDKLKKTIQMIYVFKDIKSLKMNWRGVHFYTTFNLQYNIILKLKYKYIDSKKV